MKSASEMSNEELRAALKNAYDNLSGGTYRNLERYEEMIMSDYDQKAEGLAKMATGSVGASFMWFCIGYMACFIPTFLYLHAIHSDIDLTFMVLGAMALGMALPIVMRKRARKKLEKITADTFSMIKKIDIQKKEHVKQHSDIYGFLPEEYASRPVVAKLLEYVEKKKANDLFEAINLLENEKLGALSLSA